MASSEDECETEPQSVSNYHFVDDKNEPISFAELPVIWNEERTDEVSNKQIFLHGLTDNGLQKVYKQVTAWKYDFSYPKPEISVLSKENNWINLLKPRKSFEDIIRTILISVHSLHYIRKNPEISGKALWDHISKVYSLHEVRPSENDLLDHVNFIREAVKRDETLAKAKYLVTFLEMKPRKREAFNEDVGKSMSGFITDDFAIDEDESDEEADLFDSVCAICDNGGQILPCEGRCLRSFHATVDAGSDTMCKSLGLSDEQVDAIQNFFCKNCQYKQHQCFACGKLGSSDKSSGAEVFSCVSATCGRFYHPHCVAKLLHRGNEAEAEELQKKINAGDSFTCPIHKCFVCKLGENKMEPELQFAVCRRCPKSYHRKCLPRKIAFEDDEDQGIIQRAWEGLIPDRILIYCLKHEIDVELGTPVRNHIVFPNIGQNKKKLAPEMASSREKVMIKERNLTPTGTSVKRTVKSQKGGEQGDSSNKRELRLSGSEPSKKRKLMNATRKPLNKASSTSATKTFSDEGKPSLGDRLFALMDDSDGVKPTKDNTTGSELMQTKTVKPLSKELRSPQPLDTDSKDRIKALMKEATASVTLEDILRQHKVPTTHTSSTRYVVDKTITLGKVEGSIEAVRAALQKLEQENCSIEDAKAVCEPGLLNQIIKWKSKLRVYLAPFLFGMRYTSFGRHFTKVDKLKEIVDKIRWYVQDGDMLVDFCCGANDFSCLMKERIDEMGKKCSYKNYDVLQAKNDFNFEKRDWMTVTPKELPIGSQLIMGLNPPFGVNASLANKFIDKALEFKPKLIVLIVPQETERLDEKKKSPYDLVWEDDELLAGKSFYLPGSVDINNKQIDQWNNSTPPLYLWSRPDWTAKHKAIAEQHGHSSRVVKEPRPQSPPHFVEPVSDLPFEEEPGLDVEMSISVDDPTESKEELKVEQTVSSVAEQPKIAPIVAESPKEAVPNPGDNGENERESHVKNQFNVESKRNRRHRGEKRNRKSRVDNTKKVSRISPSHASPTYTAGARSVGRRDSPISSNSNTDVERGSYMNVERAGSRSNLGTGHYDDVARRYNTISSEEPLGTRADLLSPRYSINPDHPQLMGYHQESIERQHVDYRSPYMGRQEPDLMNQRRGSSPYLVNQDSGFLDSYVHHHQLGSLEPELSYNRTSTSTMQRYAPRLDELNHTRMTSNTSLGSVRVPTMTPVPMPYGGHYPQQNYDPLAPTPRFQPDPFAPRPFGPYPPHQSSGWLND